MSESEATTLNLIEGYKFRVDFGAAGVPSLVVDELVPIGAGAGSKSYFAFVGCCWSLFEFKFTVLLAEGKN